MKEIIYSLFKYSLVILFYESKTNLYSTIYQLVAYEPFSFLSYYKEKIKKNSLLIIKTQKMDNEVLITNQPIVIDNGSGMIKAGFAGDPIPKINFPNYVGRPKHVRVMAGGLEGDIFIGPKAEEYRGLLHIAHPMEHGIVQDWNDMEKIWTYVYSKDQLRSASEEVNLK